LQINKKHPKLIRLIKKNYDVNSDALIDAGFYNAIELAFEYFYKS